MSYWINAPVVERVADGSTLLDLSEDVGDLGDVGEDGDTLVLVIRKYPGRTNGGEGRILPELDRYEIGGRVRTRERLMSRHKLILAGAPTETQGVRQMGVVTFD